jgi:hypothetical protein
LRPAVFRSRRRRRREDRAWRGLLHRQTGRSREGSSSALNDRAMPSFGARGELRVGRPTPGSRPVRCADPRPGRGRRVDMPRASAPWRLQPAPRRRSRVQVVGQQRAEPRDQDEKGLPPRDLGADEAAGIAMLGAAGAFGAARPTRDPTATGRRLRRRARCSALLRMSCAPGRANWRLGSPLTPAEPCARCAVDSSATLLCSVRAGQMRTLGSNGTSDDRAAPITERTLGVPLNPADG